MTDPRWLALATDWLSEAGVPDRLVTKYAPALAARLQDIADDGLNDVADGERDAEAAAYDAHIQRQIDEARGK